MKKQLLNLISASALTLLISIPNIGKSQAGEALNFDLTGPADYVALPSAIATNSLVGNNKITVEAWAKQTTTAGLNVIVGNYNTPSASFMQFLLRQQGGSWQFWVSPGNTPGTFTAAISAANTASLNVWQHIAGVYDGTLITIYINGVVSGTAAANVVFAACTNAIQMGTNVSGESFSGNMDEVRIWNYARTKCQIQTFMNCEIPNATPGLVTNYHFNQGLAGAANPTQTLLTDGSGNAYTGTLTNMALTGATGNCISPGGVVSGFTTALAGPNFTSTGLAVCPGGSVTLTSTGATNFTWSAGVTNGTAFTPTANVSYTYNGTSTVTSCTNSVVANVTLNPVPTISVNSGSFCAGSSFTIVPTGAASYTIQGGSAVVSPTANASYTVIGTSSLGCVSPSSAVSNVTTNPVPVISVNSGTICSGDSFTIVPTGGATYTFQGGSAIVSPTANASYTVIGTSSLGCVSPSAAVSSVTVSVCLGINEHTGAFTGLNLYPNPSNGSFIIDLPVVADLVIVNNIGQVVYSEKLNAGKASINIQNLVNGIYFVKISNADSKVNYKVVKQ